MANGTSEIGQFVGTQRANKQVQSRMGCVRIREPTANLQANRVPPLDVKQKLSRGCTIRDVVVIHANDHVANLQSRRNTEII